MTSYQSRNEIQSELQKVVPQQIEECKKCDELPPALEELIRHNFQASFVCYNKKSSSIEVGVEEQESTTSYPEIKVHQFKLEELVSQLTKTFRTTDPDLKFYGRILAGRSSQVDDVVLV